LPSWLEGIIHPTTSLSKALYWEKIVCRFLLFLAGQKWPLTELKKIGQNRNWEYQTTANRCILPPEAEDQDGDSGDNPWTGHEHLNPRRLGIDGFVDLGGAQEPKLELRNSTIKE
jgi:hypothetical protein